MVLIVIKNFILSKKPAVFAFAAAFICAAVVFITLNVPESVGLANNGDYTRVIIPAGINYINGDKNMYAKYEPDYVMNISPGGFLKKVWSLLKSDYSQYDYFTSQTPVIKLSKILNAVYNKLAGNPVENYNLFWLGLIYIIMFAAAIYLILKFIFECFGPGLFALAFAVILFVFCDAGYTMYFNSFYGEALQYVMTFLIIGLFLKIYSNVIPSGAKDSKAAQNNDAEKKSIVFWHILYYTSVIAFGASKNADIPIAAILLFPPAVLKIINKESLSWPKLSAMFCASLASLAVIFALLTPKWIINDNNFNAVFAGVLKYSENPEQDLRDLGLDPSYAVLAGYETYMSDYPVDVSSATFRAGFYDKISRGKLLTYYLSHPAKLASAVKDSAEWSAYIRPKYLGNVQNPSEPQEQSYRFSLWEKARVFLHVNNIWVTIIVFLTAIGVCVYELVKKEKNAVIFVTLMAALWISAAGSLVMPYIGNGVCDIAKHMFGFITFYDMMIFILVGYAAFKLMKRFPKAKRVTDA